MAQWPGRASGILNGVTVQALNVPAAARAAQLEHSAERMGELLPRMQAGAHVLVNIPKYSELRATGRRAGQGHPL
jgi:murein L,D-transpeptidase YcbB/YkuD